MCGFVFDTIENVIDKFRKQSSRGLDGVGTITNKRWNKWYEPVTVHNPNEDKRIKETYIAHMEEAHVHNDMILMHHRKGSLGSLSIDNVHPYVGKFILFQNGTDKRLRDWGTIENIDDKWSDSYCLLQYLDMHCETLDEVKERLDILNQKKITLGVVVVFKNKECLIYSDGARSLYVDSDIENKKIRFSSEHNGNEYDSVGYAFFNIDGILHQENWSEKNTLQVISPPIYTHWNNNQVTAPGVTYPNVTYPWLGSTSTYMTNDEIMKVWISSKQNTKFELEFTSLFNGGCTAIKKGNCLVPLTNKEKFIEVLLDDKLLIGAALDFIRVKCMKVIKKNKKEDVDDLLLIGQGYDIFQ